MNDRVPSYSASPRTPTLVLPPGACDTHVHVFGPAKRFAYAADSPFDTHVPDDGELVDLVAEIAPGASARHALLVDNPQRLYRFVR